MYIEGHVDDKISHYNSTGEDGEEKGCIATERYALSKKEASTIEALIRNYCEECANFENYCRNAVTPVHRKASDVKINASDVKRIGSEIASAQTQ